MNIDELRTVGKRARKQRWYKEFCKQFDADYKASARWLKTCEDFVPYLRFTDYYPGKSGPGFRDIELFTLRFPDELNVCTVCGKPTKWAANDHAWRKTCSVKCAALECMPKREATSKERYGVGNPSQAESVKRKRVKTFIKRFGVDNPRKAKSVKRKIVRTVRERYGVDNASQSSAVKAKKRATSMRNFGAEHWTKQYLSDFDFNNPMWDETIKAKLRETCLKRYGTDNASKNKKVIAKITRSIHAILSDPDRKRKFVKAIADAKQAKYGDPYAGHRFKTYQVEDHNGTVHEVQGYERYAVEDLAGRESVKSIKSRKVPRIGYKFKGDRTYIPDLVAVLHSGKRRLIEVKAHFTLKIDLARNLEKFKAAEAMCARNNAEFWLALVKDSDKSVQWIKNPSEYILSRFDQP